MYTGWIRKKNELGEAERKTKHNTETKVFTMDDIVALPSVDVTCTLTCAGNRRKEQNMHKQTIGFSWGSNGTSCSTWTGVRLGDVLKLCGVSADRIANDEDRVLPGDTGNFVVLLLHSPFCFVKSSPVVAPMRPSMTAFHAPGSRANSIMAG